MKVSCIIIILVFILSCKKETDINTYVKVGDFSEQIELDSIIDICLLKLNTPDTNFIGQIKDVAICNDTIFVLDGIKQSLFIFDIHGNYIQEVCRSGRAGGEYLNAFSIECDSLFVYLLDMPARKLLIYDRLLNFVSSKKLSYSSSDFKVINKNFLFNNIEDVDGNYYYNYTDSDVKIVEQFIPYNKKSGYTLHGRGLTGQMISWNGKEGQISLVRPFSNCIYRLIPEKEFQLLYKIDFGHNTIPDYVGNEHIDFSRSNYIYIEDFFDLEQYKMISFFEQDKRFYCVFSPEKEVLYAGEIKDSKTSLPFFPRWQYGNKLIGTCRGEYLKEYLQHKNQYEISTEEIDKSYLIFYSLK